MVETTEVKQANVGSVTYLHGLPCWKAPGYVSLWHALGRAFNEAVFNMAICRLGFLQSFANKARLGWFISLTGFVFDSWGLATIILTLINTVKESSGMAQAGCSYCSHQERLFSGLVFVAFREKLNKPCLYLEIWQYAVLFFSISS